MNRRANKPAEAPKRLALLRGQMLVAEEQLHQVVFAQRNEMFAVQVFSHGEALPVSPLQRFKAVFRLLDKRFD